MISEIGHYFLIINTAITFLYIYYLQNNLLQSFNFKLYYVDNIIYINTIIIFSALAFSYFSSELSNVNVLKHSNILEPLIYKICGLWGNHEGSMLLWYTILSTYIYLDNLKYKGFSFPSKPIKLLYIYKYLNLLFFNVYIILTSNPFIQSNLYFNEGNELNPILQDIGLIIHPPILYSGYLGYMLISSYTLVYISCMLTKNKFIQLFRQNLMHWMKIAWFFLTLGIALGSWWAYHELGWGGWWFWDPVENVSLIPWILSTILFHSLYLTKGRHLSLLDTIISLSIYFTVLVATFVVRSGLLTSVHSFVNDPKRGYLLLFYIIIYIIYISYKIYKYEYNKFKYYIVKYKEFIYLENIIYVMILIFTLITSIIFISIFAPFLASYFYNDTYVLGASFFNTLLYPFICISLIILWCKDYLFFYKNQRSYKSNRNNLYKFFLLNFIIIIFFIFFIAKIYIINYSLFVPFSLYISYIYLQYLNITSNKKNINYISYLIHILYFTFFFITLISPYLQENFNINFYIGEILSVRDEKEIFLLNDISYHKTSNHFSIICDLILSDNKLTELDIMSVEKRFYYTKNMWISKPTIHSNVIKDYYVVFSGGNNIESYSFTIYINNFINLIWILAILLSIFIFYL